MSISLHPSSTLGFPRPFTRNVNRTLTISNYNALPVAFKVKTTAPNRYVVKPNSGRVKPGQSVDLQVMLLAMEEEPPSAAKCKDKFMIQSVSITPEKKDTPLSDIWKATDIKSHSQKIRAAYLPSERCAVGGEEEVAPVPPVQSSVLSSAEPPTTDMTSGHSALSIPDIDKTREHVSTERTNEGGPAPVVNPTIDHPPPRQPTPQPSREQDPCENSVEATEVDRPGASLPAMPGPETKEELHSEMKHHGIPPTVIGTEIEVTSHTDEPCQPKGVPFPQQRPESPAISEILRDSFSPDEPASMDSLPLPRSTHPEMDKSLEPPMLAVSSEDLDASPGAEMLLSTDPSEIIRQDEGGIEQQLESSKTATRGPTQNEDDSDSSDEQGGQLSRRNSQNSNTISKEDLKENNSPATPPVLPPAPANSPSREELVREIADLTDRAVSISLFGSVGIGKSFVALTLLHHNRTKAKFGQNRYFMRCDDLQNSLEAFLERLSETIQTEVAKLRPRLRSSPPLILFLDGIDSILEPETSQSQEISAAIEEFGNYEHVCLVTTSRIHPEIRGFCRVEVPTLTEDGARDIFYSLCNLSRSPAVDSLIASLDFHPLAIELLASCVRGNDWDEPTLLKAWEDDQAGVLKTGDDQRLKDAIEPVLRSSAIAGLEIPALVVLGAIAASQFGVKECELEKGISGTGKAVDVLSKFSLVYRQDGLVKMFAPIRSYFVEFAPVLTPREQVLCEDVDFMPGAWLSVYDSGRLDGDTSRTIQGPGARPGWNWNLGLPGSVIRKFSAFLGHRQKPTIFAGVQDPTNTPAAAPE